MPRGRAPLIAGLLLVLGLGLVTWLEPWYQSWSGSRTGSANLLSVALGDSRRLFAKHFYVKADAYFHSGYYPSIFDERPNEAKLHMAANAGSGNHHEDLPARGKPNDWIDRFGRHFHPSVHSHLGEAKCNHPHHAHGHVHGPDCKHDDYGHVHGPECKHEAGGHADHDAAVAVAREQRELLPWLKLAATLDPDRPETYVTAAYWMRSHLGKTAEAEQFIREGLQHIPGEPELLFELGRIYRENHKDINCARRIWEAALVQFRKTRGTEATEDILLYAQILVHLIKLEEEATNYAKGIEYLKDLLVISPNKTSIQKWIDNLSAKLAAPR
jgi:tetratricopeptide (TPR) repeat protein